MPSCRTASGRGSSWKVARISDSGALEMQSHWGSAEAAEAWRHEEARRAQQFGPATELMLDFAGLAAGQRVLDVAAGTGEQTILAAERVGPTGWVLATDVSASMLEVAATAARTAGLSNVETRVMDAGQPELDPQSFDTAICRNGLQWIPQPDTVLWNIYSALRIGGTLSVLVHGAPERNPWTMVPSDIVRRTGSLPALSSTEPHACVLGGHGVLAAAFQRAGFRDIAVQPVTIERHYPTAAAAATNLRNGGGSLSTLIASLRPELQEQAWVDIERAFERFAGPDWVDLSTESLVGAGTR